MHANTPQRVCFLTPTLGYLPPNQVGKHTLRPPNPFPVRTCKALLSNDLSLFINVSVKGIVAGTQNAFINGFSVKLIMSLKKRVLVTSESFHSTNTHDIRVHSNFNPEVLQAVIKNVEVINLSDHQVNYSQFAIIWECSGNVVGM